jgi:6-phosphofructokinase 1
VSVLGHIQRGGNPTVKDRLMAYRFVTKAIDTLIDGTEESVICHDGFGFNFKSIEEVTSKIKELDSELLSYVK